MAWAGTERGEVQPELATHDAANKTAQQPHQTKPLQNDPKFALPLEYRTVVINVLSLLSFSSVFFFRSWFYARPLVT